MREPAVKDSTWFGMKHLSECYVMIKISLLGPLYVVYNDELVSSFISTKAQALFCYLLVTKQPHSRHALAGLFWGDDPEEKAKNSLRVALANLRTLFPDYIETTRQTAVFHHPLPHWQDTTAFASLVREPETADIATLEQAAEMIRGEFLEDFHLHGAPEFEEWLLGQRAYWREQSLHLLSTLARRQMVVRNYQPAIATLHRLLQLEPWQEAARRQLMQALSALGEFNSALCQYELCCQLLQEELGVAPMPETTALYERIQTARQARPVPIPADDTLFIDRITEMGQIQTMLANPACRLITIVGLGGTGKTRLALAAARQANRERALMFLNGVLFVSLAEVTAVVELPLVLAEALGLRLTGHHDPARQLVDFLHNKELLLVLDNFEHLLPSLAASPDPEERGVKLLTQILNRCPAVKLMVTSREPLNVAAEWRLDLEGLAHPVIDKPSSVSMADNGIQMTDYPAVQLFLAAARQVRPDFEPGVADLFHAGRLCYLVAGIPLAIKLAAVWVRAMSLERIVGAVEASLDILATQMRDAPRRQRSVRAVFNHTWDILTAEEQTAFASLSVFGGSFTETAAAIIARVLPFTLAGLVDRGLVQLDKTAPDGRYTMHALARQYAAEKLAQSPEVATTIRRAHTRFFADQLATLTPDLTGPRPAPAYNIIHQELGNIRLAWQYAVDHLDLDSLQAMVTAVYRFYLKRGCFGEGRALLATATAALQATQRRDKRTLGLLATLFTWQGALMGRIGQFSEAEADLRQSIAVAQTLEEPQLIAWALVELGSLLRDQSQFAGATRHLEESLAIARDLDDPVIMAQTLAQLGLTTWDQGGHCRALATLREALALCQQQQDVHSAARILNSLGNVSMSMGDYQEAAPYFQEALALQRELEDWLALDTVLINLGMMTNELENYAQARAYYEESLAICRRIGDEVGVAYCLTGIGQSAMGDGDLAAARQLIGQSLALNRVLGRDRYVGINLNLLGDLDRLEGNRIMAGDRYQESLGLFTRIDHPWGIATTHNRMGELAWDAGQAEVAHHYFQAALSQAYDIEAWGLVKTVLVNLAAYLLHRADTDRALLALAFVEKDVSLSPSLQEKAAELLNQATFGFTSQGTYGIRRQAQVLSLDSAVAAMQGTERLVCA